MPSPQRKLFHLLASLSLAAGALPAGCSTRPVPADEPLVSLGAFDGGRGWTLGAGDALGSEIFATYLALHEREGEPLERYARDPAVE
jgi:hypothetical protein